MTDNERDLINIIRESDDPEKVASYMLNLFLDYLDKKDDLKTDFPFLNHLTLN